MSNTEHTPTPWQAVEHSWSTTGIYAKNPAEGGVIAVLCIEGEATEDTQAELEAWMAANATFIVRAVNSHAALFNALTLLSEKVAADGYFQCQDELKHARAALAAAEV